MKNPDAPILVIIVPCYNEEEVFPETARRLSEKITRLVSGKIVSPKSSLLFIDDGSADNTWGLIESRHRENRVFGGIRLSKNYGHQNALLCGLLFAGDYADLAISIDADLQDDVDAIDKMISCYLSGDEIVLGVRSGREEDSFFKRASAAFFYGLMCFLGADLVPNHADFRLMGREAIRTLEEKTKTNTFLRGIVPHLGYETGAVYYSRKKRMAGKSKYTLRSMLKFALGGILSAGITGNFLGRIFRQTKNRPEYKIEKVLFSPEIKNEVR